MRVPVSVLDKRGQPILGLRGEDFLVSENGQKQAVTYFSGERRPLRIALALDVSASMAGKMRQVSEALRHFIDLLEPADEIMVITFSADVSVDQDFTSDRDLPPGSRPEQRHQHGNNIHFISKQRALLRSRLLW